MEKREATLKGDPMHF